MFRIETIFVIIFANKNSFSITFDYMFRTLQIKLSVSGRDFDLTLIARRSRHYAGTRYAFWNLYGSKINK